ncbi:MAG TPA: hypothetical protein VJQ56_14830 [Blastocatellia bacterium]|nr:hypothetical protein [Blastocatellia bacterium]
MKNIVIERSRAGERGAVGLPTLLLLVVAGAVVFLAVKFVPVYAEQKRVLYDVNELANKATVRGSKEDHIAKEIKKIRLDNELPEDSITLTSRDKRVHIVVGYTRTVDLLFTTYEWQVKHTAVGKEL